MNWQLIVIQWSIPFFALWFVWQNLRRYLLDKVRHDLFTLRSELFFKAASNELGITFNSEAYRAMENYCNMHIRFAHRFQLLDMIIVYMLVDKKGKRRAANHEKEFNALLKKQSAREAAYYIDLKKRIDEQMFQHFLRSNAAIWFLIPIAVVFAVIFQVLRNKVDDLVWTAEEKNIVFA